MTGPSEPARSDGPPTRRRTGMTRSGPRHDFRPDPATVLTTIGACCVVLGGLVAAVTGPLDLAHGSWLAAYLVLVAGVAQYAMGQSRRRRPDVLPPRRGWAQIGCWNVGNVLVIGATLAAEPLVVDLGSILLVIALAIALRAAQPDGAAAHSATGWAPALFDRAYRMLPLVLAVSIPIGMALSHWRPF